MNMKCHYCWKVLLIYIGLIFLLYLRRKDRMEKKLIDSDLLIHSFNPTVIQLTLNIPIPSSDRLSIIDKHLLLFQFSNISMITMMFTEGYHHLYLSMIDSKEQIEYYQTMEISTGSQSLLVTVLNNQSEVMKNIPVHLELVHHPQISFDSQTNQFGQVTFSNLPGSLPIYIEAFSQDKKSQADIRIDHLNERNLTLILKELPQSYDDGDEYDPSDRGYYAI